MRVLLFSTSYMNGNTGSEVRAHLLAAALMKRGITLGFVTPDSPDWVEPGTPTFSWLASRRAIASELQLAAEAFRPDVIWGITEGLADLVIKTSRRVGCASAFDLHGIGIVEVLELGAGYGSRWQRSWNSLRWLWAIRQADAVSVANPTLLPVITRYVNPRTMLAAGCADLEHFSPAGPKIELGPADRLQVMYAGNFLRWQGVDMLLEAARILLERGAPYDFNLLVSFGKDQSALEPYRSLFETGRVRLLSPVSYEEMPALLRSADVLTIPRPWMRSTHLAFPQKISDYMAAGRAIVATDLVPHRYAITDGQTGVLCAPDPTGLAEALLRLESAEVRDRLGRNARAFAEQQLSVERVSGIVAEMLDRADAHHRSTDGLSS